MTDDLVARLLAAIQEAFDEEPPADVVLGLSRAHRKVVETYQGAVFTQECHPEYEDNNGYVKALADVLGWLAEGYGIESSGGIRNREDR